MMKQRISVLLVIMILLSLAMPAWAETGVADEVSAATTTNSIEVTDVRTTYDQMEITLTLNVTDELASEGFNYRVDVSADETFDYNYNITSPSFSGDNVPHVNDVITQHFGRENLVPGATYYARAVLLDANWNDLTVQDGYVTFVIPEDLTLYTEITVGGSIQADAQSYMAYAFSEIADSGYYTLELDYEFYSVEVYDQSGAHIGSQYQNDWDNTTTMFCSFHANAGDTVYYYAQKKGGPDANPNAGFMYLSPSQSADENSIEVVAASATYSEAQFSLSLNVTNELATDGFNYRIDVSTSEAFDRNNIISSPTYYGDNAPHVNDVITRSFGGGNMVPGVTYYARAVLLDASWNEIAVQNSYVTFDVPEDQTHYTEITVGGSLQADAQSYMAYAFSEIADSGYYMLELDSEFYSVEVFNQSGTRLGSQYQNDWDNTTTILCIFHANAGDTVYCYAQKKSGPDANPNAGFMSLSVPNGADENSIELISVGPIAYNHVTYVRKLNTTVALAAHGYGVGIEYSINPQFLQGPATDSGGTFSHGINGYILEQRPGIFVNYTETIDRGSLNLVPGVTYYFSPVLLQQDSSGQNNGHLEVIARGNTISAVANFPSSDFPDISLGVPADTANNSWNWFRYKFTAPSGGSGNYVLEGDENFEFIEILRSNGERVGRTQNNFNNRTNIRITFSLAEGETVYLFGHAWDEDQNGDGYLDSGTATLNTLNTADILQGLKDALANPNNNFYQLSGLGMIAIDEDITIPSGFQVLANGTVLRIPSGKTLLVEGFLTVEGLIVDPAAEPESDPGVLELASNGGVNLINRPFDLQGSLVIADGCTLNVNYPGWSDTIYDHTAFGGSNARININYGTNDAQHLEQNLSYLVNLNVPAAYESNIRRTFHPDFNWILTEDFEIPAGIHFAFEINNDRQGSLTVPEGLCFTVPARSNLVLNGAFVTVYGTFTNNGAVGLNPRNDRTGGSGFSLEDGAVYQGNGPFIIQKSMGNQNAVCTLNVNAQYTKEERWSSDREICFGIEPKEPENLTTLVFPADLTAVMDEAFAGITIQKLDFAGCPDLESIGDRAFANSTNLRIVVFTTPDVAISDYAFDGCTSSDITFVAPAGGTVQSWATSHGFGFTAK